MHAVPMPCAAIPAAKPRARKSVMPVRFTNVCNFNRESEFQETERSFTAASRQRRHQNSRMSWCLTVAASKLGADRGWSKVWRFVAVDRCPCFIRKKFGSKNKQRPHVADEFNPAAATASKGVEVVKSLDSLSRTPVPALRRSRSKIVRYPLNSSSRHSDRLVP